MDHADLKTQVAGCLEYAGESYTFGVVTFSGVLKRVAIEDLGLEVDSAQDGFIFTYAKSELVTQLKVGSIITSAAGTRYRAIKPPSLHPTSETIEVVMEEISL